VTAIDEITATPRPAEAPPGRPAVPVVLAIAAIASLGAGAIHATAAGAHSEHRAAVVAFVLTAIAQLGWGAWALNRTGRLVSLVGAAVNGGALGGWLLAKTSGISFVAGLETTESPQFADSLAAALATVAVLGALVAMDRRLKLASLVSRVVPVAAAVVTVALVIPGMVSTGSHAHAGDDHTHSDGATPPVPYTATLPVDLGGVPGVSDQEVAEAEVLVTSSILKLPQFADVSKDEEMGYRSIGDGLTGWEHYIKWEYIADGRVLDPDYPESLVFKVDRVTGEKTLAAAMFMANVGTTLETVPKLGGALVQWHVHDNLCFRGEPNAWRVAGMTQPDGTCRPGTFKLPGGVPMVHVWIIPHECGPFAALEGVGAGQIATGEERLCDHAHGEPS
jgi:hypothetical protein